MKKVILLILMLVLLVGCKDNESNSNKLENEEDTSVVNVLEKKLAGEWLLIERHMVIEFSTEEDNYVEFKDTFDLESQVQTRYIRYSADEEYVLENERANITSFYVQTFGPDFCDVENYVKTENSYYTIVYGEDEVAYKLDPEKSSVDYADVYEINGFTNKVAFMDENIQLTLSLTADDFIGDPNYATVKSIDATMTLKPYLGE